MSSHVLRSSSLLRKAGMSRPLPSSSTWRRTECIWRSLVPEPMMMKSVTWLRPRTSRRTTSSHLSSRTRRAASMAKAWEPGSFAAEVMAGLGPGFCGEVMRAKDRGGISTPEGRLDCGDSFDDSGLAPGLGPRQSDPGRRFFPACQCDGIRAAVVVHRGALGGVAVLGEVQEHDVLARGDGLDGVGGLLVAEVAAAVHDAALEEVGAA